jgi:hypothetical protein
MRFMILVKASKGSEAGVMPSQQLLTEMGKFNEELAQAGVLLAAEGLQPSSKGGAARLGLKRSTLLSKMQRLGISRFKYTSLTQKE